MRSHSSDLGHPALSPGWKQAASFTGIGSKTLTNLNIRLTQLWGFSAGCTGDADLSLQLVDVENIGTSCTAKIPVSPQPEPQSFQLGNPSRLKLDTIIITAPSNLTWYLRIANSDASAMPFLNTLTASKYGWVQYSGMGGSGAKGEFTSSDLHTFKTLGVLMLCDRKGTIQINFNAPSSVTKTFSCNTNTTFSVMHFGQSMQLQNILVHGSHVGYWWLTTVLCTNEKACSSL